MTTREKAIQIFRAALAAVQPARLIPPHLYIENDSLHIFDQHFLINELQNIYIVGAGKASAAMAVSVEGILGDLVTAGIVVTKYAHSLSLKKVTCIEAAHPSPDEKGIAATLQTIELLKTAKKNDIIICLISGGASSLWIDIPEGASLADVQETFQLLLKSGAGIEEINVIRKHLSAIKGGQLLQYAPQATWFSFIISDVPGDRLDSIASGPTVWDTSTFEDVETILEKYALTDKLPAPILLHITKGIKGIINDTFKANEPVFKQVHNQIIGNNSIALEAAANEAKQLGYYIPLIDNSLNGDAATAGGAFTRSCQKYSGTKPACFLLGGETTVMVTGNGKGGRNQHMALSALCEMSIINEPAFQNRISFLSAGTDGTDGPTDAAGAFADTSILVKAIELELDPHTYLNNHDAYHFFEQVDGLVNTGPTHTNVMDLVAVIIE